MSSIIRDKFGRQVLSCPYNAQIVGEIRQMAPVDKQFNGDTKEWTFSPHVDLTKIANWLRIRAPQVVSPVTLVAVTVEYIGASKTRADGSRSSYGWAEDGWNVVFPESVLRTWFKDGSVPTGTPGPQPAQATTFYGVLGISNNVDGDQIKRAYRVLARQWHPDVCREPDAQEQFLRLKKAYDVLIDPQKRKRYDLGLSLTAKEPKPRIVQQPNFEDKLRGTYRPPMRSGVITGKITVRARLEVTSISGWDEVRDSEGRILVTSWEAGATHFTSKWLDPNYFSNPF